MKIFLFILGCLLSSSSEIKAFSTPSVTTAVRSSTTSSALFRSDFNRDRTKVWASAAVATVDGGNTEKRGLFEFKTKAGWINPFSIYYGAVSILLGLPWFVGLSCAQLVYTISRNKVDVKRRIPIFLSHCWGVALLHLTRSIPKIEGQEILNKFYKE